MFKKNWRSDNFFKRNFYLIVIAIWAIAGIGGSIILISLAVVGKIAVLLEIFINMASLSVIIILAVFAFIKILYGFILHGKDNTNEFIYTRMGIITVLQWILCLFGGLIVVGVTGGLGITSNTFNEFFAITLFYIIFITLIDIAIIILLSFLIEFSNILDVFI